jgi:hypothetical protein
MLNNCAHARTVRGRCVLGGDHDGPDTIIPVKQIEGLNELYGERSAKAISPA